LRELIATARSRGYAITEQQLDPGMRGIAVPIRSPHLRSRRRDQRQPVDGKRIDECRDLPRAAVLREVEHSLLALL